MSGNIDDTGKVWFPGTFSPVYALRVGDKIFVPGVNRDETISHWADDQFLYVDLHNPVQEKRIARRFSLDLPPTSPATLFSGFQKTRHRDVLTITFRDEGVDQFTIEGDNYRREEAGNMSPEAFLKLAKLLKN